MGYNLLKGTAAPHLISGILRHTNCHLVISDYQQHCAGMWPWHRATVDHHAIKQNHECARARWRHATLHCMWQLRLTGGDAGRLRSSGSAWVAKQVQALWCMKGLAVQHAREVQAQCRGRLKAGAGSFKAGAPCTGSPALHAGGEYNTVHRGRQMQNGSSLGVVCACRCEYMTRCDL